jgi:putative phosphoesterase
MTESFRVAVLADTHMPRRARALPEVVVAECVAADLILHCGDFTSATTLAELELLGEVLAVSGNNDDEELVRELPERRIVEVAGVRLGMLHIGGERRARAARLEAAFPDCHAILYGHSHQPSIERGPRGTLIVNPGSACDRRREPTCTMVRLEIVDRAIGVRLLPVP